MGPAVVRWNLEDSWLAGWLHALRLGTVRNFRRGCEFTCLWEEATESCGIGSDEMQHDCGELKDLGVYIPCYPPSFL